MGGGNFEAEFPGAVKPPGNKGFELAPHVIYAGECYEAGTFLYFIGMQHHFIMQCLDILCNAPCHAIFCGAYIMQIILLHFQPCLEPSVSPHVHSINLRHK